MAGACQQTGANGTITLATAAGGEGPFRASGSEGPHRGPARTRDMRRLRSFQTCK